MFPISKLSVLRTNVTCVMCVTSIKDRFLIWKMQMVEINLQSAVSGNHYTVKFSKAVQSGDV